MKSTFLNKLLLVPSFLLLTFMASCQNKSATVAETVAVDVYEKMLIDPAIQLIDVRTPEEYNSGHLKNAINIDYNGTDFASEMSKLDKHKTTLIYCLSGGRSANAMSEMQSSGFEKVYNMQGGILKWKAAGKEVVSGETIAPTTGMSMEEFTKIVTSDKYVLVDFNATWCKPCKQLKPILEKIESTRKDKMVLIKIDVDENRTLSDLKKIDAIPYLELYKDGKMVWSHQGFITEEDFLKETKL
jgi:thioredoxin